MTNQPNNTPLTPETMVNDFSFEMRDSSPDRPEVYSVVYTGNAIEIAKKFAQQETYDRDKEIYRLGQAYLDYDEKTTGMLYGKDCELKEKKSRIAELERENEKLKDENLTLNVYNHSRKIENKTLMSLLEQWFRLRTAAKFVPAIPIFHAYVDEAWQSYCKEHNLAP